MAKVKQKKELTDKKRSILTTIAEYPDETDTRVSEIATESLPEGTTVTRGYVSKIKSDEPELVDQFLSQARSEDSPDSDSDSDTDSESAVDQTQAESESSSSRSVDGDADSAPGSGSIDPEAEFDSLTRKKQVIVDTIARHRFDSDSRVEQHASELLPGDETVSRAYVSMVKSDYPKLIQLRDTEIEDNPESTRLEFADPDSQPQPDTESQTQSETETETEADKSDSNTGQHLNSKGDYHDLTDKMRAIVDAIAEDPDAGDTRVSEIATEKLPSDVEVSRAYVPRVRESQGSIIDSRIETQANTREFQGTSETTGDPFADTGLTASPDQETLEGSSESSAEEDTSSGTNSTAQLDSLEEDSDGWQMISERPAASQSHLSEDQDDAEVSDSTPQSADQSSSADGDATAPTADGEKAAGEPQSVSVGDTVSAHSETTGEPETDSTQDESLAVEIQLKKGDVESLLVGEVPDGIRTNLVNELVAKAFN